MSKYSSLSSERLRMLDGWYGFLVVEGTKAAATASAISYIEQLDPTCSILRERYGQNQDLIAPRDHILVQSAYRGFYLQALTTGFT